MKRRFLLLRWILAGPLLFLAPLPANDSPVGSSGGEQSLDLPRNVSAKVDDHEEAPDVLILHGAAYQGDGFVFVGAGTG